MKSTFRPTAIPLITSDPYFSIWSFNDKLYGDHTRHWTGHTHSMFGVLFVDGKPFRFTLIYPNVNTTFQKMLPILKEDMAKAGIQLDILALEWSVILERVDSRSFDAVAMVDDNCVTISAPTAVCDDDST